MRAKCCQPCYQLLEGPVCISRNLALFDFDLMSRTENLTLVSTVNPVIVVRDRCSSTTSSHWTSAACILPR